MNSSQLDRHHDLPPGGYFYYLRRLVLFTFYNFISGDKKKIEKWIQVWNSVEDHLPVTFQGGVKFSYGSYDMAFFTKVTFCYSYEGAKMIGNGTLIKFSPRVNIVNFVFC